MRTLITGLALAAVLTTAACGSDDGTTPSDASGTSGPAITQRAIAWVALQHLSQDTTRREATYTDDESPAGLLGADLRYGGDGESDGDLVRVSVSPAGSGDPCRDEEDSCAELDAPAGSQLFLWWDEEEPEEDPGLVHLLLRRDDADLQIATYGQTITGDPRDLDLDVPLADMEAVVTDERLGLTTTQEVLDGAADLQWDGGEPDPTAYDRVPSTDVGIANAYVGAHGGYSAYSGLRPSPLKEEFGPGAIGGEVDVEGDYDRAAGTVDMLAAPQAPAWLAAAPCDTPRFAGHCVDQGKGRYLAWVPGPAVGGGEIWMFGLREDEVVAVRAAGFEVPERQRAAEIAGDWYFVDSLLLDDTFGLETDKNVLEFVF